MIDFTQHFDNVVQSMGDSGFLSRYEDALMRHHSMEMLLEWVDSEDTDKKSLISFIGESLISESDAEDEDDEDYDEDEDEDEDEGEDDDEIVEAIAEGLIEAMSAFSISPELIEECFSGKSGDAIELVFEKINNVLENTTLTESEIIDRHICSRPILEAEMRIRDGKKVRIDPVRSRKMKQTFKKNRSSFKNSLKGLKKAAKSGKTHNAQASKKRAKSMKLGHKTISGFGQKK